jgi:type IV pilus assembly protein PilM
MKKYDETIIEITHSEIKTVQAKTDTGKPVFCACGMKPLEAFTDEAMRQALSTLVHTDNLNGDNLWLMIPRRLVLTKPMRLPSTDTAEIRKMVTLQLVEQTPHGIDDLVYDYQILDQDEEGYTRVLVSAVPKNVAQRFVGIFQQAGVYPRYVTVSSYGIVAWWQQCRQGDARDQDESVLLINMDTHHTEICFCQQGKLYFSRSIPYGSLNGHGPKIRTLINQVALSLKNYHEKNLGPTITRIYLITAMDHGSWTDLKKPMGQQTGLPVEGVSLLSEDMVNDCEKQKRTEFVEVMRIRQSPLTVAMGALHMKRDQTINLAPEEAHLDWQRKRTKNQWTKVAIIGLVLVMLSAGIFGGLLFKKKRQLDQLTRQIKAAEPKIQKAMQKNRFLEVLDQEFAHRVFIPELLRELFTLTPEEISFVRLRLNKQGLLDMQGYAQTGSTVNTFQSRLVRSSVFENVNLQFAKKKNLQNMDVTEFKIRSDIGRTYMMN